MRDCRRESDGADDVVVGERVQTFAAVRVPELAAKCEQKATMGNDDSRSKVCTARGCPRAVERKLCTPYCALVAKKSAYPVACPLSEHRIAVLAAGDEQKGAIVLDGRERKMCYWACVPRRNERCRFQMASHGKQARCALWSWSEARVACQIWSFTRQRKFRRALAASCVRALLSADPLFCGPKYRECLSLFSEPGRLNLPFGGLRHRRQIWHQDAHIQMMCLFLRLMRTKYKGLSAELRLLVIQCHSPGLNAEASVLSDTPTKMHAFPSSPRANGWAALRRTRPTP